MPVLTRSQAWLAARGRWLVLLLTIPALLPLAAPGYFLRAHDAAHTLFFLTEYDLALRSGATWPIWGADFALGFGYPVWLVYAPLAYMVAEGFHLLGLGLTAAIKATWALSFLAGALGMYQLARRWWGTPAAIVSALLFTYAPYHLVQIYVRAALAEFAALAWFPWALLAFDTLWEKPTPRRLALAGLALAGLLLTHTVSEAIFLPLLGGYLLLKTATAWFAPGIGAHGRMGATPPPAPPRNGEGSRILDAGARMPEARYPIPAPGRGVGGLGSASSVKWARRRLAPLAWSLAALALGIMLAAVFLVPAFLERGHVAQAQWVRQNYDYARQFVYPAQYLSPFWGYGYAVEGPDDGMSLQLGLMPLACALAGTWAALWQPRQLKQRGMALLLVAATLVALLSMLPIAEPVWRALTILTLLQFPWRLLALTVFTLALLGGAALSALEAHTAHGPLVPLLAVAIVLGSYAYLRPELVTVRPRDESALAVIDFEQRFTDMRGMTSWSERLPADADSPLLPQYLAQPDLSAGQLPQLTRAAVITGQGSILSQSANAISAEARVSAMTPVRLRFFIYYFPGWQVMVDGAPVAIEPDSPNGLIGLNLPPGEHDVKLRWRSTPLRTWSGAASLAALAGCLALLVAGSSHLSISRSCLYNAP